VYDSKGALLVHASLPSAPTSAQLLHVFALNRPLRLYYVAENLSQGYASSSEFVSILPPEHVASVIPIIRRPSTSSNTVNPPQALVDALESTVPLGGAAVFAAGFAIAGIWNADIRGSLTGALAASDTRTFIACMAVGGLLAALVGLTLRRRYGWNRNATISWAVGLFLLSWAGILMLLAMAPFPERITCPACGKKRLVEQRACDFCGAEMPAPPPDGAEIFAPADMTGVPAVSGI
jgi:hypothetical protein